MVMVVDFPELKGHQIHPTQKLNKIEKEEHFRTHDCDWHKYDIITFIQVKKWWVIFLEFDRGIYIWNVSFRDCVKKELGSHAMQRHCYLC